jgi:hypothetical protein
MQPALAGLLALLAGLVVLAALLRLLVVLIGHLTNSQGLDSPYDKRGGPTTFHCFLTWENEM